MKKYFINIIFFVVLISNSNIYADDIIDRLDSDDWTVRYLAVREIIDNNLVQYTSALADRVFNQPILPLVYNFLEGLFALEYVNIEQYTLQFIDICDQFPNESPLLFKVKATELLVALDNFTTIDYVFEFVNLDPVSNGQLFIPLLKEIAIKIPQHSQTVKDLLINIKDNSQIYSSKKDALENLILIFGAENLLDEILFSITNDPDLNMRSFARQYYNFTKELLQQQIQNDDYWGLRTDYAEKFLNEYTEPWDVKFIKDYSTVEPNDIARGYIENLVWLFIPPQQYISAVEMTDKILLYTDSLYSYGWITNQTSYNSYKDQLTNIKKYLLRGLHNDALAYINSLLNSLEILSDPPPVTDEGYTFLHYPLTYLQGMIH